MRLHNFNYCSNIKTTGRLLQYFSPLINIIRCSHEFTVYQCVVLVYSSYFMCPMHIFTIKFTKLINQIMIIQDDFIELLPRTQTVNE